MDGTSRGCRAFNSTTCRELAFQERHAATAEGARSSRKSAHSTPRCSFCLRLYRSSLRVDCKSLFRVSSIQRIRGGAPDRERAEIPGESFLKTCTVGVDEKVNPRASVLSRRVPPRSAARRV
ncbi:hypothetical protein Bbelb_264490 [Branchiostoma belcheri]|nr:hypothetical protein Bbelb_264490 [Branchiostoma belcheri]